jgi:excisionase family DNA binding protein
VGPDRERRAARFLTLTDVAEVLNISMSQTYALVRSRELRALKIGGRGQWRVEDVELENFIATQYGKTADLLRDNPAADIASTEDVPGQPTEP